MGDSHNDALRVDFDHGPHRAGDAFGALPGTGVAVPGGQIVGNRITHRHVIDAASASPA